MSSAASPSNNSNNSALANRTFLMLALRSFAIWLVVSLAMFIAPTDFFEWLTPFLEWSFNLLANDLQSNFSVTNRDGKLTLQVTAMLLQDLYIETIPVAPAGYRFHAATELIHNLVPVVIMLTGLLSWPLRSLKERLLYLSLGLPALFIVIALTVPTLLLGHVQAIALSAAENMAQIEITKPFIMQWVIFLEVGGRWLLPIVALAICLALLNVFRKQEVD
ncbi:MAG: hypothetical protein MI867_02805 [Pseudomonadales bacterium]|nr:hypothetical protein [Pseudomonadales bacterium]